MAKLMLNYAHAPKVNYLYIMNNDFIGFVEKLSKQEKEILKAKLIWKRKNKKEEPKQETLTYTEAAKKEERIFNSTMMYKQETLEEAAERWFGKDEFYPDPKQGFIAGAKWQQENTNINALNFEIDALKKQIKLLEHNQQIMYNKEDVILILMEYDYSLVNEGKLNSIGNIKKWFEQFKNK